MWKSFEKQSRSRQLASAENKFRTEELSDVMDRLNESTHFEAMISGSTVSVLDGEASGQGGVGRGCEPGSR